MATLGKRSFSILASLTLVATMLTTASASAMESNEDVSPEVETEIEAALQDDLAADALERETAEELIDEEPLDDTFVQGGETGAAGLSASLKAAGYPTKFTKVSTGFFHAVAIGENGKLYTWGSNEKGALGTGENEKTNRTGPKALKLPGGATPKEVASGDHFSFVLGSDGKIYAWGQNNDAQLGIGTRTDAFTPTLVRTPAGKKFKAIGTHDKGGFAISEDGKIWLWGKINGNFYGSSQDPQSLVPVQAKTPANASFAKVTGGRTIAIALTTDGKAYSWGTGDSRLTGADNKQVPSLVPVPSQKPITDVAASYGQAYILDKNGTLYSWGTNAYGSGVNQTRPTTVPTAVIFPSKIKLAHIDSSLWATTAVTTDGSVYGWGHIGIPIGGSAISWRTPRKINFPDGVSVTKTNGGVLHFIAQTSSGFLYGIGNSARVFGADTPSRIEAPIKIVFTKTPAEGPSSTPSPGGQATVSRVFGDDRYGTSLALNQRSMKTGAPVFVVTGETFPDALAAGPAVRELDGSLVLTNPSRMDKRMVELIKSKKPSRIYILGGTNSVSSAVQDQLKAISPQVRVDRFGGEDRYSTSLLIAKTFFPAKVNQAWIADGNDYPDALTASAAGGAMKAPVLLIDGNNATASPGALDSELKRHQISNVNIVGGPSSIKKQVEQSLRSKGFTTNRFAGADRYATNEAVDLHLDVLFPYAQVSAVWIATGKNFPDALSAAAVSGYSTHRLVLSNGTCLPQFAFSKYLDGKPSFVTIVGGPNSLNQDVFNLKTCR